MSKWKTVQGYEGLYKVSDKGYVKNIRSNRILSTSYSHGYKIVKLSKNNKLKTFYIHRLVLGTFTGNRRDLQVNHKNGIKTDNSLTNLEWTTRSENIRHAIDTGLITRFDHNKRPIKNIRDKILYSNLKEAANDLGINYNTLKSGIIRKSNKYSFLVPI